MTDRPISRPEIPGLPAPVGPYSHATVLGNQVFVSGLLPLDLNGQLVGRGDASAQAEHVFATLGTILAGVGSDFGDVAKVTIYLTDLADRAAVNDVRKRVFGDLRPASTMVQVAGLIGDGTLLELEAIAAARHVPASGA
jgi:2-iminobutanoate/2-iminopropanoate deaminase